MKPLLIVCLCLSSWMLIACKPSNSTQSPIRLSHNQAPDIKTDMELLQTLAQQQNNESAIFQQHALNAIRSGSSAQINQVVQNLRVQINKFNQQLLNLALSSSEVDSIRNKMIHSYNLSLELAQQGAVKQPDTQKIEHLQQQLAAIQKEIHTLQDQAQSKVNRLKIA